MTDRAYVGVFLGVLACAACSDSPGAVDEPVRCSDLPTTFSDPELVFEGLQGSEDIAISARGKIVARKGAAIVRVREDGETEEVVANFPASTGMRFIDEDSVAVGNFVTGKVVKVGLDGSTEDLVTDIGGANGVFVDGEGRVWVTGTGAGKLVVRETDGETRDVLTGLSVPNGVVYDAARNAVFVNELSSQKVYRVDIDDDGNFGEKVEVTTLPTSALPDGQALDVCGNLYVISYGGKKLFRVLLDAKGDAKDDPEDIATFPGEAGEVANPVFARGIAPTEIYVTGNPGNVYRIDVGVESAKNIP